MITKGQQPTESTLASISLSRFGGYFLKLGTLGFGGPNSPCGSHATRSGRSARLGVQARLPGRSGLRAIVSGSARRIASDVSRLASRGHHRSNPGWCRFCLAFFPAFVLPSFLMVLGLAALYVHFGSLPWIQGMFYGIGAAVIAIIVRSAIKLVRTTVGKDWLLWTIFAVLAITTAWTKSEIIWLFILCGAIAMLIKAPPRLLSRGTPVAFIGSLSPLLTGIHGLAWMATVGALALFFLKAGAFVFGSGLAIVPFLYGGVVANFHWLTERQFVDAVAVAMITPGPVVITAAFIGYLVAGPIGSAVAAWAVFAPPYLIVLFGAPYYRRFAQNPQVKAFVEGVTAAAVGAITGAAYILARRSVVDTATVIISLTTLAILMFAKKNSGTDGDSGCRSRWSSSTRKGGMRISIANRALINACFLFPGMLCLSSLLLIAQSQPNAQAKQRQMGAQEPLRSALAIRVERGPKMGGTLDDPLWQKATPMSNFLQREPFEGQPPTEKTEIRILYDRHQVYFGVTCFDSDPKEIVATELRRDVSQELDDYFEIIIDSAHDRRNAYIYKNVFIPVGEYHWTRHQLTYGHPSLAASS
jgi:chromate transporter